MEIISTHETDDHKGFATVNFNSKSQVYEIKFYDDNHHLYYTETKEHLDDAQSFADDWVTGENTFFHDMVA